ncbi:MAG: sugar kinase [Dehalococcoidia bacterium SM23_28_2]|nr:MAG: sugar kinase [Dehalococcoidia bacterium SM23_28_2]
MMLIAGTVPIRGLPLTMGRPALEGDDLVVEGRRIPCAQGTGAMISAALAVADYLKLEAPQVLVAGDTGQGKGSREIYEYLIEKVGDISPQVVAMALMNRLCESVQRGPRKVLMIADAGSMYAAKAAGLASRFDVFTPDAAEMAFLADPDATHPAYIARHLFDADIGQTPDLVAAAYRHKNAARLLLVKGAVDYVVDGGGIVATVDEPDVPALEAVGGTGDTITGLVAAFLYAGLEPQEAAIIAARSNRMAGKFAGATPATRVRQIVEQLQAVFKEHLCQWSGVCCATGGQQ